MTCARIFKLGVAAFTIAAAGGVFAQQSKSPPFDFKPYKFKCVIMIFDRGIRGGGPYIGKWKDDFYFLETKMLGIGPLLLRKNEKASKSEIYAPSKIDAQCDSMKIDFERVEKKFPHAVASLAPVSPAEAISMEISLLSSGGEFSKANLRVNIFDGALMTDDFVMYRSENFQKLAGILNLRSDELTLMSREFCQIVNGAGAYAHLVDECVAKTLGQ